MSRAVKEIILKAAREIAVDQEVCPMLFLTWQGAVVDILPLATLQEGFREAGLLEGIEESNINRAVMYLTGKLLGKKRVKFDSFYHISEAWMLSFDTEEKRRKLPRPSEHPDRVEVLILNYSEGLGKHESVTVSLTRTPDGPVFGEEILAKEVDSILLDSFWIGVKEGKEKRE